MPFHTHTCWCARALKRSNLQARQLAGLARYYSAWVCAQKYKPWCNCSHLITNKHVYVAKWCAAAPQCRFFWPPLCGPRPYGGQGTQARFGLLAGAINGAQQAIFLHQQAIQTDTLSEPGGWGPAAQICKSYDFDIFYPDFAISICRNHLVIAQSDINLQPLIN